MVRSLDLRDQLSEAGLCANWVIAIIDDAQREYPVSDHILRMRSVLKPVVRYRNREHLRQIFRREIIEPAERLVAELRPPLLV